MTEESVTYQTYKPYIPKYMSGYTGFIPSVQKDEFVNKIIHTKHIPGYCGYVSSIKCENKFGESYGKETFKSLSNQILKGSDVPSYIRYTSTSREDYKDQSKVKTASTASLLGIPEPNIHYKKSIPIDTINKFYGVESLESNYNKDYEKFWEFLDSNELDFTEKNKGSFNKSNMRYWGVQPNVQDLYPSLKFDPIPGYMGTTRSITSENIYGMTYKNSLRRSDELKEKIEKLKADQLFKRANFKLNY